MLCSFKRGMYTSLSRYLRVSRREFVCGDMSEACTWKPLMSCDSCPGFCLMKSSPVSWYHSLFLWVGCDRSKFAQVSKLHLSRPALRVLFISFGGDGEWQDWIVSVWEDVCCNIVLSIEASDPLQSQQVLRIRYSWPVATKLVIIWLQHGTTDTIHWECTLLPLVRHIRMISGKKTVLIFRVWSQLILDLGHSAFLHSDLGYNNSWCNELDCNNWMWWSWMQ